MMRRMRRTTARPALMRRDEEEDDYGEDNIKILRLYGVEKSRCS